MSKAKNLEGERFGRLVAIERTSEESSNGSYIWLCKCDCGNEKTIPGCNLRRGTTKSCGCMKNEQLAALIKSGGGSIHGMKGTPVYKSWCSLLIRARSTDLKNYENVTVCDEWNPSAGGSFINFLNDMGHPPEGYSINRIHGAKLYSKETCEWADKSMQGFDQKRNIRNKTGKTGVYQKADGKFRAKITKDGKVIFLGDFDTLDEAVFIRKEAEIKYYGFTKE